MRTSVSVAPPTWSVPPVRPALHARQVEREARAEPVGQRHGHGPLDDVVDREAGPEVITVEYDAGARAGAGDGGGLLRHELRRDAAQEQHAFHYGRLKMMTMPLVTDTIDGRPSASGVR